MRHMAWQRGAIAALVAGLALALSACLLSPGKFTSTLDLRRDGRFTFTYVGEIHMLALGKLAAMGNAPTFSAQPCHTDNFKERPCTPAELAEQRRRWSEERSASASKETRDAAAMKAMLGGIDPSSPQAPEELAARLRRQAGWRSVIYKGDGLFVVDFALTSRLDHDFTFPTVERMPMANAFVQLTRRADGTVRVDAPGFAPGPASNPFTAMMDLPPAGAEPGTKAPALPQLDGVFTLTTDGQVLANSTDEGPQPDPAGQRLGWTVNPRMAAAPTALIRLGN